MRGEVPARPRRSGWARGYSLYNYAYYVFGAAFNDIFVLHIALFSLSIAAVVLTIGSIDVDAIGSPIPRRERSEGQTVGLFHANADVPGVKLFPLEGVVLASGFAVATFALLLPHRKR